jgi:hypothetical protein
MGNKQHNGIDEMENVSKNSAEKYHLPIMVQVKGYL